MMNAKIIEAELGIPMLCFDKLTSTNDYAREADFRNEIIVVSDSQSEGKGRIGKEFFSPEGGLYFTYAFQSEYADAQLLTIRCADAVSQAIDELCRVETQIKWVNDIYIGDKKVCGILCEYFSGRIIIGIGINIAGTVFPEELSEIAGCIPFSGDPELREKLLCSIVSKIKEHPQDADVLDYYRSRSYVSGKAVSFVLDGDTKAGVAIGIDDDGSLVVGTGEGIIRLNSGEVSVKPLL